MADDEEVRLGSRRASPAGLCVGKAARLAFADRAAAAARPQAPAFDPTVMKKKKAKARTRPPRQTPSSTANRVSSCFRSGRRAVLRCALAARVPGAAGAQQAVRARICAAKHGQLRSVASSALVRVGGSA
jgi:hypothetical protein